MNKDLTGGKEQTQLISTAQHSTAQHSTAQHSTAQHLNYGFFNADCIEEMKKMPDRCINLTLTDIPYDGVNNSREHEIRKFHKDAADEITFDLEMFLSEVWRITKGTIIIFCGNGQFSKIFNYFICRNECTVRQIIWQKSNPSPVNGQYIYLSGVENAVWVKKRNATFNAFCKNTVFKYPCGSSELHPTEKNHELLAELITDNSNVGDIILDPCSGSGSTLLVAHELGRKYIGFELNHSYYELAKRRLDAETSQMNIFDFLGGKDV